MPHRHRLIAGAAGLAYVVGAAVENMGLLDAPLLGAGEADVRAAHADRVVDAVGCAAGAVSLACYLAFAVVVRRRWAWAGVAGALLAAVGVVASALMISTPTVALSELALATRYLAGPFMALFLVGAAARSGRLRVPGFAVAVPLALAPLALTGARVVQVAAILAFGLHSLWIFCASLRLLFGGLEVLEAVRRAAFLLLVVAAGAVGVALLAVPGATGTFFAWGLKPTGLAAFAGGVYVGSAVVYAAGLRVGRRAAWPLVPGAVVLSVSVLAVTLVHLEVFDLSRLQAWAWLVLFAGFALVTAWLAVAGAPGRPGGMRLSRLARVAVGTAAAASFAAAVALWADPGAFGLPPLGGRFAGSWSALLAALAGWAAWRDSRDEAVLPALALIVLPLGALLAAVRTGSLDVVALVYAALIAIGALALRELRLGEEAGRPSAREHFVRFVARAVARRKICDEMLPSPGDGM